MVWYAPFAKHQQLKDAVRDAKPKKPHKYRAQSTIVDGKSFPSKLEASVYSLLKLRERAGEFKNLKCQVTIRLKDKCDACGDGPIEWKCGLGADALNGGTLFFEA